METADGIFIVKINEEEYHRFGKIDLDTSKSEPFIEFRVSERFESTCYRDFCRDCYLNLDWSEIIDWEEHFTLDDLIKKKYKFA